jgi:hypothetical protein
MNDAVKTHLFARLHAFRESLDISLGMALERIQRIQPPRVDLRGAPMAVAVALIVQVLNDQSLRTVRHHRLRELVCAEFACRAYSRCCEYDQLLYSASVGPLLRSLRYCREKGALPPLLPTQTRLKL